MISKFVKKKIFFTVAIVVTLFAGSCSKGGNGGGGNPPPSPPEENLVVAVDPDPGTTVAKALSATYDFKLKVNSTMPAQGIEGTVVFRKEQDNSLISSQNISGTSSPISITISNISLNEVGIVTVDVKSKSKPSNTANKTFKLARK